jgi:hypothetical protein
MTWMTIRNFGRVKYFNLSYFVVIGVPILAEVYGWVYSTNVSVATLAFPLNLKLLYSASLLYAVAITIYQYFCPGIIKRFEDEQLYVSSSQEIYERAHPSRKLPIVLANLVESQNDLRTQIGDLQTQLETSPSTSKQQELHALVETEYPSAVQRYLLKSFDEANQRYPSAIYASGLLYLGGTLIMLYLIGFRTWRVFSV